MQKNNDTISNIDSHLVRHWQYPVYTVLNPDCENKIRIVYRGWLTDVDCILFFKGHTRHGGPPIIDDLMTAIKYVCLNTIGGHTFFNATGGLWFWSNFFSAVTGGPRVQINWSAGGLGKFSARVDLFIHAGFDAGNRHDLTVPMTPPGVTDCDAELLIRTGRYVKEESRWGDVNLTGIMSTAFSVGPEEGVLEETIFPLGRVYPRFEYTEHRAPASGQIRSDLPVSVNILSTLVLPLDSCQRRDKNLLGEVRFELAQEHGIDFKEPGKKTGSWWDYASTEPGGACFYDWAALTQRSAGLPLSDERYGDNRLLINARHGPGRFSVLHHCVWSERG